MSPGKLPERHKRAKVRYRRHRVEYHVPDDLYGRLTLARSITGETWSEVMRSALDAWTDRILFRRPGAWLWLRPGARVWVLERQSKSADLTPRVVARAAGGERVWPISRVKGLPVEVMMDPEEYQADMDAQGRDPKGQKDVRRAWETGYICDVSPDVGRSSLDDGGGMLAMRRVLVLCVDILPRRVGNVGGFARKAAITGEIPPENRAPIIVGRERGKPHWRADELKTEAPTVGTTWPEAPPLDEPAI